MTTLTTSPLAPLLHRLFAEAEAAEPLMRQAFEKLSPEDRKAAMGEGDYRAFYMRAKDFPLPVSRETGALLYMLARATGARSIVEFGTSFGISTLHLAAALKDNGGGRLVTTEFEPSKVARARATFAKAGVADLIEIREGDALETLARDLPDSIDLVLLDGAKALYPAILALVEGRLRSGALILADNANWSADYLARVRSPSHGYISIPFGEDVELSMKLGGPLSP
ncbi:MAG TPA: O-methyltransferase [Stellaceae bacterium]|nr:O-methyltransferase [Stellaceae bacterium]